MRRLASPIPYDTNVKMNPPLREVADRDAMLSGIVDGSVDAIATDHAPHHYDEKRVEFDRAPFGIVGLETAVSLALDRLVHAGVIRLPRLVELLSVNPARILGVARRIALARYAGGCDDSGAGSSRAGRGEAGYAPARRTRRSTVGSYGAAWRRRSSAAVRCSVNA